MMSQPPKWYAKSMLSALQGVAHLRLQDSCKKRKFLFPLLITKVSADHTHKKYRLIRTVGIRKPLSVFLKTGSTRAVR